MLSRRFLTVNYLKVTLEEITLKCLSVQILQKEELEEAWQINMEVS